MKKLFLPILLMSFTFMISSCASSEDSLKRVTAKQFNLRSSEVEISNVERGVSTVSWNAKSQTECFECEADDMVRDVHCIKVACDSSKNEDNK